MSRTWDPMEAMEEASKMIEFAAGYREKCEAAGFSSEAATQMAVDLHRGLIRKAFGGGQDA